MTATLGYGLIFALTFFVVGLTTLAAWLLVERGAPEPEVAPNGLLRRDRLSALSLLAPLLNRLQFAQSLKRLLAEAQVNWTVGRLLLTMAVCAALAAALLMRLDFVPWWGAITLAVVAGLMPLARLHAKKRKRLQRIEEQLPEALDFISRALVAGHSLPMSLELLAEEIGPPLATELRKTVDEYNVGATMDEALENFAERVPSVDIRFFASAIMTQARTGGSLHELLETLAETIRERGTLKGQVRALTANGRMTAIVLSLLPLFIAVVMYMINPEYFGILLEHPIGKTLVFVAVCAQVGAYFVIQKIVDIKV